VGNNTPLQVMFINGFLFESTDWTVEVETRAFDETHL
jgi:hypothetical protein